MSSEHRRWLTNKLPVSEVCPVEHVVQSLAKKPVPHTSPVRHADEPPMPSKPKVCPAAVRIAKIKGRDKPAIRREGNTVPSGKHEQPDVRNRRNKKLVDYLRPFGTKARTAESTPQKQLFFL